MSQVNVLIELKKKKKDAFSHFSMIAASVDKGYKETASLFADLAGYGIEETEDSVPIPMFTESEDAEPAIDFTLFSTPKKAKDTTSLSQVVPCSVSKDRLEELSSRDDVIIWPDSEMFLLQNNNVFMSTIGNVHFQGGVDCRPFRDAVTIETLRHLLCVEEIWESGFRGQNIIVGIMDEGVDGSVYPVVGGFAPRFATRQPGSASITSHGSMCAADILVAAPAARIYDYPFLGVPRSGGAIRMYQAALDQRRIDGTPHLTNHSYGFIGVPNRTRFPNHEVHNINHPAHRKLRELIMSGAPAFFAAGNCGRNCPSGNCHVSGIGPGKSIHGGNSLREVITVSAVNSQNERVGYSSQGPGMFHNQKPDISAYTHFYGNKGPGRPAGGSGFDNGTSAASPIAAGVGALLLSKKPGTSPKNLKKALCNSAAKIANNAAWSADYGHGIINAGAALELLE